MRFMPVMPLLPIFLLTATGCSSAGSAGNAAAASVGVRVDPGSAAVERGGTVAFRATVTGTAATNVKWVADCGSITETGLFTAPQLDGVCRVTATTVLSSVSATALVSVGGWAAACAAEPEPTTNVVYACDCQDGADAGCVPGSDANSGTKTQPVKSWNEIQRRWRALPAGGTVALCKGGRWPADTYESGENSTWKNTSCTAAEPCTIRDYAAPWGGTTKPTLVNTVSLDGIFKFWTIGNDPADVLDGIRILNLRILRPDHGTINPTSTAIRAGNRVTDVEVCNVEIDGMGMGAYVGGADVGKDAPCTTRNWKLRGNIIKNSCVHGFFGYMADSEWDGNYFDNNGHAKCGEANHLAKVAAGCPNPALDCGAVAYWPLSWQTGGTTHTVYFNPGSLCSMDNMKFINNEVHRNAVTDVAYYSGQWDSVHTGNFYTQGAPTLKFIAGGKNWLVENNLIDASLGHPTMAYIAIATANQDAAGIHFDGFTVRRNRVINGGPHTAFQFRDTRNLLVEDNTLSLTSLADNKMNEEGAIYVTSGNESTATNATVRNNTIHVTGLVGRDAAAVRIGASAAPGQVVTGNSMTFDGGGAEGACIRVDDPARVAFMDNNQCSGLQYFAAVADRKWSLADWRLAHPAFDALSITPPVAGLFVNAPTDLTPEIGSPLIDTASALSTCTVGGMANQPCSSTVAIGLGNAVMWGPLDAAKTRGTPDIGAVER